MKYAKYIAAGVIGVVALLTKNGGVAEGAIAAITLMAVLDFFSE